MTEKIHIRLLGDRRIEIAGNSVSGPTYEKGWALLAYLITEPRRHSREEIGELFWPNAPGKRANLRQVLSNLRSVLKDHTSSIPVFQSDRNSLRFNPDARILVDALELTEEQSLCRDDPAPENCAACIAQNSRLALMYRGDFLSHLTFLDCPDFENWLQIQREKFHRKAVALLEELLICIDAAGDRAHSLAVARRLEEIDPFNEKVQRHYLHRYVADGQIPNALKQYEAFSDRLYKELGASPELETRTLYEQIRAGNLKSRGDNRHPDKSPSPALPERRQVTVLYGEFHASGYDLEDIAERQLPLVQQSLAIIRRRGGLVVQTHGGNFLAYFGYPIALENAALLAVRAALEISRSISFPESSTLSLHTGQIVTGEDRNCPDAAGQTTDIAVRLCHAATSGDLILSDSTHALVSGYVKTRPHARLELRPTHDVIQTYLLLEESPVSTRLDAAVHLTPMVGRKRELAYLKKYWGKTTKTGANYTILVQGEPGIGKSRLVKYFAESLGAEPHTVLTWHCHEEYCGTALHTVTEHLSRACAFTPDDSTPEKIAKLESYIAKQFPSIGGQSLSLLARLLTLNPDGRFDLPELTPQQEKLLVFDLLLSMLGRLAAQTPLLFVLEDVHWADHSTLELLDKLLTQGVDNPLLVLLTARPEFQIARKVLTLNLPPLSKEDTTHLIGRMRPCHHISPDTMQLIIRTTDGVPLFIEEMTRTLVDEGNPSIGTMTIPATLQDLLAARLDRLGEEKILAQAAATVGRQFSMDLLQAALPDKSINDIHRMLLSLEEYGLISMPAHPAIDYHFRHALIADTAYQSLTRPVRRIFHGHIANTLSAQKNTAAEVTAKHFFEAGELRQAIEWWIVAGTQSAAKCANTEAIRHFNRALDTVAMLPATGARDEMELNILVELGATLVSSYGYGSPQALQAYQRAFALSEKAGLSMTLFRTIWGLYLGCSSQTNHRDALELAERLLELARIDGSAPLMIAAHYAHTNTAYSLGSFADAIGHMEAALGSYHPDQDDSIIALFGEHVLVSCMQFGSWALWTVGRSADSLRAAQEALAIAERLDHPPTLCFAYCFCGMLYRLHGEIDQVRDYAEALSALAAKQDFGLWQVVGNLIEGWAQAARGEALGISRITAVVDVMRQRKLMGGIIMYFLEMLAEAHGMLGDYAAQMTVLNEAIAIMGRIQDVHFEAEIYRLKGVCLLHLSGDKDLSRKWLERAKEVASLQGAIMLERRIDESLSSLNTRWE
ncbi:MAG: AAA family ATPase [Ferrovum sp.]|nr:AAA family ATPase [Ferrovum sp.]NDU87726.1 AAA family ATPase [Ferrovum sp.]